MAETDILNATVAWRADISDSIAPEYGWERMRRSQLATVKPAFGRPWSRTVGNGGHSTQFSWMNRSRDCVERLKQWAEQHEDGFFTVIDHDGRGRHYVGRFVGDMPYTEAGHDRYNIQGWTFEEIPGCPMLQYPADWDHWAVFEYPVDAFGDRRSATDGAEWVRPAAVVQDDGSSFVPRQLQNLAPTAGNWISHEYRGYGFRLYAPIGPAYGIVTLQLDGVDVTAIDLYSAVELPGQVVYTLTELPLDIHRIKLVLYMEKNAASTGYGMVLDKIEVMR